MILYHGTNVQISEIDLMHSKPFKDITLLLITERKMEMEEALDTLYNSETYAKLNDSSTGLYYQSPRYVLSFLLSELETGKCQ